MKARNKDRSHFGMTPEQVAEGIRDSHWRDASRRLAWALEVSARTRSHAEHSRRGTGDSSRLRGLG